MHRYLKRENQELSSTCTGSVHVRRWASTRMMRQELGGRQIAQRLMRPYFIGDLFPLSLGRAEGGEVEVAGIGLVELFGVRALCAFDATIELRRAGRQDEEANPPLPARLFEQGRKLTASVHLKRGNAKGHAGGERVEEAGGGHGGRSGIGLDHIPPRDDIAGSELFEDETRQWPDV